MSETRPVRTRFAPSPTGYLHIGGVRTALFCWLFARQQGGQFILRIDDTDRERNVDEALAPILHGLKWLGIDWDEGPDVGGPYAPYYQSQRMDRHQAAVRDLLDRGAAYWDYATTEEIQAERDTARAEGKTFIYSRRWLAATESDRKRFEAEGRDGVVRLMMPREGTLVIDDLVRGRVEFEWASEQDHVVQRSNGTCLYHLASAVDDHDLEISHVIRAEEHLPNTPRQVFIAQSLGYELPRYAHLPYVAEPGSRNKLSKRKLKQYLKNKDFAQLNEHGRRIAESIRLKTAEDTFNPVIVDFYEQTGYLPEAIVNYLLLLGWSLDDKTEFFTREEMIRRFTLDRVNKAPASFDPAKLMAFQAHYMRELPLKRKVALVLPYLQKAGLVSSPPDCDVGPLLGRILEAAGDRIKVAGDIVEYREFFVDDDQICDPAASDFQKWIVRPAPACGWLEELAHTIDRLSAWNAAVAEATIRSFADAKQIKLNEIVQAVRVSVSGRAVGFGLFETLDILGPRRAVTRMRRAAQLARRSG